MSKRIRTPEDVMAELDGDLFVIMFRDGIAKARLGLLPSGMDELVAWFEHFLPGRVWEKLAPSPRNGILVGGIGNMYAIYPMSADDIACYSAKWETGPDDMSVDPRWRAGIFDWGAAQKLPPYVDE